MATPEKERTAAVERPLDAEALRRRFEEWALALFRASFEQVFANELGAYNTQKARRHLPELTPLAWESLTERFGAAAVAALLEVAGDTDDLNEVRARLRDDPRGIAMLGVLTGEMPQRFRDEVLPRYFGGKQPLTDLDMGEIEGVEEAAGT